MVHKVGKESSLIQNIVTGVVILMLGGIGAYQFTLLAETVKKVNAMEVSMGRLVEQNRTMNEAVKRIETKVDNHMQASIVIQTPPASNQIRHN